MILGYDLYSSFYQALGAPPTFFQQHITTSCKKRKTPLTLIFRQKSLKKQKTPLTEIYSLSRTNNTNTIRGATLIHGMTRALSRIPTYPRHLYACLQRRRILGETCFSFDCALSGPFAKQFLTRLSAPRALCVVLIDVISASTVSNIEFIILYSHLPTLSTGKWAFLKKFQR